MSAAPSETVLIANDGWLAELRAGDCAAIASLRARLRAGLGAALFARRAVSDADLDDFAQDAVVRVLERLDSFRGDSHFTTWAMAVAIRVSLTALRRRSWAARSLDDVLADADALTAGEAPPAALSARGELIDALRHAIATRLSQRQRAVLLGELGGVPQVVLADRLGSTPGAIYKVSHDARRNLKAALAEKGFDAATVRQVLAESR